MSARVKYGIAVSYTHLDVYKRQVREHVQAPTEKFSFALAFKSLFTNKPLFSIMITNLVINLAFIMKMTLNYYYTTYTLGDVKLMSLMSLITLPSILLGTATAPFLTKLVGKKKTLLGLMIANLVISAIFWLVGYGSIPLVLLMGALQILCVGASFVVTVSYTHLDVYKRQHPDNHKYKEIPA